MRLRKAIDSFIAKVKNIKFKAKVDDADIEKLTVTTNYHKRVKPYKKKSNKTG